MDHIRKLARKLVKLFMSKQFVRFVMVGVFNTGVDYLILNVLHTGLGIHMLLANTVSSGVALGISFFLNRKYVFKHTANMRRAVILFFACSLFNIWVLQNAALWAFHWVIVNRVYAASDGTLVLNVSKLLATSVSLVANYLSYHYIVFRKDVSEGVSNE